MPTGSDLEIVKAKDLNSFNRIDWHRLYDIEITTAL